METAYFSDRPWSFGGKQRIKDHNKDLMENEIDDFLSKNDIYTRFKPHRKASTYSPIYVYKKRELFQADVVFFTDPDMVKVNSGYRYMFTCIDCFTKMAWVFPLKSNNCESVMNSFKNILSTCGQKPERLNSDRGSELICKKFTKYLAEQKIHHYLSYSLRKCPIVERFNLTIQNILYKIMAQKRSLSWSSFIDQAMTIYLNRKHSTIGMSPLAAEKTKNHKEVRTNLLKYFHKRGFKKKKAKFSIGDTVRIWSKRRTFQRGYDESYSKEYFTIYDVKTNLPVPRYLIKDSKGDNITGSFFEDELVKYVPGDTFEIEVIKKRKRRGATEFFVHYMGYPKTMDEWVTEKQLKNL